jgi:hypothetical protein
MDLQSTKHERGIKNLKKCVEKRKGKGPFARSRHRREGNKMPVMKIRLQVWTAFTWLRIWPVAGFYEHGNEPSFSQNERNLLAIWAIIIFSRSIPLESSRSVKMFLLFDWTRRFITVLTGCCHQAPTLSEMHPAHTTLCFRKMHFNITSPPPIYAYVLRLSSCFQNFGQKVFAFLISPMLPAFPAHPLCLTLASNKEDVKL